MKFVVFVVFVVLAVAHAKFLMAPYELSEALEKNEIATQKETLYVPMAHYTSCNQPGCNNACHSFGYRYGYCINDSTCKCHN